MLKINEVIKLNHFGGMLSKEHPIVEKYIGENKIYKHEVLEFLDFVKTIPEVEEWISNTPKGRIVYIEENVAIAKIDGSNPRYFAFNISESIKLYEKNGILFNVNEVVESKGIELVDGEIIPFIIINGNKEYLYGTDDFMIYNTRIKNIIESQ